MYDSVAGQGYECKSDVFYNTVDTEWLRERVARVRKAVAEGRPQSEIQALKRRLPMVTWQALSKDGRHTIESSEPSGMVMLDVDHIADMEAFKRDLLERAFQWEVTEQGEQRYPRYGIVVIHITPSGQGIRIVARMTEKGLTTIAAHQAWLAERMGIVSYDTACSDVSRPSYLVALEDFLFIDNRLWEMEKLVEIGTIGTIENIGTIGNIEPAPAAAFRFKGMLISEIAEKYLESRGMPEAGERHSFFVNMVKNFRFITDNDAGVMLSQLPDLGKPRAEREKIIDYVCARAGTGQIPYSFWKFLEGLGLVESRKNKERREQTEKQQTESVEEEHREKFPPMPPVFNEYCRNAPREFVWPMVCAMAPILGALTTRARATYLDGSVQNTTFHSVIFCMASAGKSHIRQLFEDLTEQLRKRDQPQWERERLYKKELKQKRNSDQLPRDPHVPVRIVSPVISIPKLLDRQNDALGLHQITFTPEVDTVIRSNKGGRGQDKNDLYRQAWDSDYASQDYMMTDTFSGEVKLMINFLLTGTPKQVQAFYGNAENGLISRISIAEIRNQEFARMPKFRPLTETQRKTVQGCLERLDKMTYKSKPGSDGNEWTVMPVNDLDDRMAFMQKPLEDWLEQKRMEALTEGNLAKDHFRRRAALKAFRLAMVSACLYDKLTPARQRLIRDFCLWFADKDTDEHIRLYGEQFTSPEVKQKVAFPNLLHDLPPTFSLKDLQAALQNSGVGTEPKVIVYRWNKYGLVTKNDNVFTKTRLGLKQ